MHRYPSSEYYSSPRSPSQGDSASESDALTIDSQQNDGCSSKMSIVSTRSEANLKHLPSIFLMGLPGSGKSSIESVIFDRTPPHLTSHLEPTEEVMVKEICHNSLMNFQLFDFPGGYDFSDMEFTPREVFKDCSVLIFVIDSQQRPLSAALNYAVETIQRAYHVNKNIMYRVFIHKMDEDTFYSNEHKIATIREVETKFRETLYDLGLEISVEAFITSVYDDSIYDVFSRIVQLLIPPSISDFLENLLSILAAKSCFENVFLFDVVSRLYVSTNDCPHDNETDSLATHVIDVLLDVSSIYGNEGLCIGFDEASSGSIKLQTTFSDKNRVVMIKEVGRYLVLVCILQEMEDDSKVLERNIKTFRRHLEYLFDLKKEATARGIL